MLIILSKLNYVYQHPSYSLAGVQHRPELPAKPKAVVNFKDAEYVVFLRKMWYAS